MPNTSNIKNIKTLLKLRNPVDLNIISSKTNNPKLTINTDKNIDITYFDLLNIKKFDIFSILIILFILFVINKITIEAITMMRENIKLNL